MGQIRNSKDLLMVLLYAKGRTGQVAEPITGKTRLVKMVFLFDKEIRRNFNLTESIAPEAIPTFEAYDFGPFAPQVYEDLEFLVNMGFVDVAQLDKEELLPDEVEEYEYWQARSGDEDIPCQGRFNLTDVGKTFVEKKLEAQLTLEQWAVLHEFKKRCTSASLSALLHYVYSRYPDMTKRSKIRDRVLGQ